jgi:hypothetical protein
MTIQASESHTPIHLQTLSCISLIPKQLLPGTDEEECFEILHTLIEETRLGINLKILVDRQHEISVRVPHSPERPDEPTGGA